MRNGPEAGDVIATMAAAIVITPLFALLAAVPLMWLCALLHEHISPAVPAIGYLPAFLITCCVAWFKAVIF